MEKELVFIVEDDRNIRELVRYALEAEGFETAVFENAEDMLNEINIRIPRLILLDIMLPATDGITALKILRERYKNMNLRIILLTAKSSEINKVTGLNSGADDYITKPFSVLELVARVKANLKKYAVEIQSNVLVFKSLKLNITNRDVFADGAKINLTLKEFELLKILMQNVNSVVSRDMLLNAVWGYEYFGQTRTLDMHIKTLRGKLGGYGDNIITFRGVGYCLKEGNL